MAIYNINFSDPLRPKFVISPGGYNGPGSSNAKSPLRLYGEGALAWGESVDENMLRMLENFSGATPPVFPISGMLWQRVSLYRLVNNTSWYWYDMSVSAGSKWKPLVSNPTSGTEKLVGSPTGNSTPPTSIPGFEGAHYFYVSSDGATRQMYRYGSTYEQTEPSWMPRWFDDVSAIPTQSDVPTSSVVVYNEFSSSWEALGGAGASAGTITVTPHPPAFTGDTVQEALDQLATNVVLRAGSTMTGLLTLSGAPTADLHAATKKYVDDITTSGGFKRGMLMMWSPTAGPIPDGWALCNGLNGTPDLRNKFPLCSGDAFSAGATGGNVTSSPSGAHSHSTNVAGAHSHGGYTGSTQLSTEQLPAHNHTITGVMYPNNSTGPGAAGPGWTDGGNYGTYPASKVTDATGSGQGHAHTVGTDGNHSHATNTVDNHTHETTPPFYALSFIMKL